MDDLKRLAAEQACIKLMVGYCVHADHDRADEFAAVFCDDGVWIQGSGEEVRGRDALRAYIRGRSKRTLTRHVIANMMVDVADDGSATGVAYAVAFRDRDYDGNGPAPMAKATTSIVEYHDEFTRTAEGWKIKIRRSVPVFR